MVRLVYFVCAAIALLNGQHHAEAVTMQPILSQEALSRMEINVFYYFVLIVCADKMSEMY
jgi:hypothetical protein